MNILAIETATEACSAALAVDGEIIERYQVAPRRHTQLIHGQMEEVLAETGLALGQLDAIAFGRGPGAFTGVRIATSVVQGVAFALDLPVIPISTLAALAQGCEGDRLLVAIDARMNEVYWGVYRRDQGGLVELVGEERVVAPEQVPCSAAGPQNAWEDARPSCSSAFCISSPP